MYSHFEYSVFIISLASGERWSWEEAFQNHNSSGPSSCPLVKREGWTWGCLGRPSSPPWGEVRGESPVPHLGFSEDEQLCPQFSEVRTKERNSLGVVAHPVLARAIALISSLTLTYFPLLQETKDFRKGMDEDTVVNIVNKSLTFHILCYLGLDSNRGLSCIHFHRYRL